ncbi:MAG: hypothetical protein J6X78_00770 [Treponema sp.]|nr:hypothetical protein [Treponema sp.]
MAETHVIPAKRFARSGKSLTFDWGVRAFFPVFIILHVILFFLTKLTPEEYPLFSCLLILLDLKYFLL